MSGYLRSQAEEWEPEHYARAAWLGRARSAPAWWIGLDLAWHIDRRKLPSAREAAEHWCVDKNKAARLLREGVEQQAAWEQRADRKAAILRILEEWASKEPKRATASRIGTQSGQGAPKGVPDSQTGDHDGQRIVASDPGQERDSGGTGGGQGRDTSRTSSGDQPTTVQPPVATVPPADAVAPPAPPVKAKAKAKTTRREPHPAHPRFGPLWDEARRHARMAPYPWPKGGAEAGRTWKAVADLLDAHVSRGADRLEDDLGQLRAAMDRFHRKAVQAYPSGHTVLGFCTNATAYLDATAHRARDAPTGRMSALDVHEEALALLESEPPFLRREVAR